MDTIQPAEKLNKPKSSAPCLALEIVNNFDACPDTQMVSLPVLRMILGKSRATVYRWIDAGILPPPRKLGASHNLWTAGEIRAALGLERRAA